MNRTTSNKGKKGVESIRVGGMTLDTLPIAEGAYTKEQWPGVVASNRQQEIENIKAEYPKGKIVYFDARIQECKDNIKRIKQLKIDQQKMIDEYTAHISLCRHRDKMIRKCDENTEEGKTRIKELQLEFPPYNVAAMQDQIQQCRDAIYRADGVVDAEYASITELRAAITKCEERDRKLAAYGEDLQ